MGREKLEQDWLDKRLMKRYSVLAGEKCVKTIEVGKLLIRHSNMSF